MPEKDDVSKIHDKYTLSLINPSSHYISLAASIVIAGLIGAFTAATYLGSTDLISRPTNWEDDASAEDFYQYQYIRENIAGEHRELWYHEQGDQSWLVVTRNTITHEITKVELAQDVSRSMGRGK